MIGAASATLGAAGLIGGIPTSAMAASCPDNNHPNYDTTSGRLFAGNYINIRTGPSTACTSLGQGQRTHNVQYNCYKSGENGTWTYLRDTTTGVSGWVKDSLLSDGGSYEEC